MSHTSAIQTLSPLPAQQYWTWRGFPIAYQAMGTEGPAVILIHGFGASWGHWRQNIPVLAQTCRVYALDLVGFGGSAKPEPGVQISYTFETWAAQVIDFCHQVVGGAAFLVGNSIGCIVALQAAVETPGQVQGVGMLNCSLRLLHDKRRAALPWYRRMGAPLLQQALGWRWLGHSFFKLLARRNTVKRILEQAYATPDQVTDELVDLLLGPAADPGAADVFLAFTRYSSGPLPEDLLETLAGKGVPVWVAWGVDDPWEPVEMGRQFETFDCVESFVELPGAGHCPQDEVPDQVNQLIHQWVQGQAD